MPSLDDAVFLSPAMSEVIVNIKSKHTRTFSLAERLNVYAHTEMFSTEIPREDRHSVLIACLLQRSVSTFQGVVLLAWHGMPSETSTLLRTLVETTFKITAISKDPEVGATYIQEDLVHRLQSVKKLRRLSQPSRAGVSDADLQNLYESIEREIIETKASSRNTFWFADKAGLTDLYHATYSVLSDTVHVNVRDLEKILESTLEGDITGFNYGPSDEGLEELLLSAIEMQINCLESAFTVLPSSSDDELKAFRSEFIELCEQRETEDKNG